MPLTSLSATRGRWARRGLRFERTLLQAQAEASPDGILVVSSDGKMIYFNRRFVEMWEIPAHVVESRSDDAALNCVRDKLADPEAFLRRVSYLYDHPEDESHEEIELVDGRVFDRHSAPVRDEHGNHYGRVWFFRDVTAERASQRAQKRLADIVETSSDAIFSVSTEGIITQFNPAAERLYGYGAHEAIGSSVGMLLGPDRVGETGRILEKMQTGEPVGLYETKHLRSDGASIDVAVTVSPVRDSLGRVVEASWIARDVRHIKNAQARQDLLAEGTALFSSSLDRQARLEALASLFSPRLADYCVVHLLGQAGRIESVVGAGEPVTEQALTRLLDRYPIDPASDHPVAKVMRGAGSQLFTSIPASQLEAMASDPAHLELLRALGVRQALVVALATRGRTLGALSLGIVRDGQGFDTEQVALVEELADHAALALDNAELHEQQTLIAHSLQASLLPARLPQREGLELASRYRPAGEGIVVGGDFYDVFNTPAGLAISMGDVAGKGPEAAAVTALARYTLREAAMHNGKPHAVLEQLNDVLRRQYGGARFLTATYAVLVSHPPPGRLWVATAGHPPPLLMHADGRVDQLKTSGLPLGLWQSAQLEDRSVRLRCEDTVLFYTDGLTDARAPQVIFSADDVSSLMLTCTGLDAQTTAERITQAVSVSQSETARDDIALVVLRVVCDRAGGDLARAENKQPAPGRAENDEPPGSV